MARGGIDDCGIDIDNTVWTGDSESFMGLSRSQTTPCPDDARSDQDPYSAPLRPSIRPSHSRHLPLYTSPPRSSPYPILRNIMGVTVETITPGDGVHYPRKGDTVTIHYVGTLLDGRQFDSSRQRGEAFHTEIGVGRVIKGWDEGVPQLSLGEKAVLTATADYAYGSRGFPPVIPPNATLKFEVELLKIN